MLDNLHFENKLNTAVLFLVFNRLDTTKQVFSAIRRAKPPKLYVAADGARQHKEEEAEKVAAVRDYILSNIDWECDVQTLFRDNNLGCKTAVSSAITWFFDHEEQGIILEDDCLPCQSFFWFCEELLNTYKSDMRVWHISGDNFQWGKKRGDGDYYFSKYNHIWGWATWADRWQHYDVNLDTLERFKQQNAINNIFEKGSEKQYWLNALTAVKSGKIDTWDYQWSYCVFINSGLSILPNTNLIKNIGFGADATHTLDLESKLANIETEDINLPLQHPSFMLINQLADISTGVMLFSKRNPFLRVINKLMRLINGKELW